jgi:hypothetical protein
MAAMQLVDQILVVVAVVLALQVEVQAQQRQLQQEMVGLESYVHLFQMHRHYIIITMAEVVAVILVLYQELQEDCLVAEMVEQDQQHQRQQEIMPSQILVVEAVEEIPQVKDLLVL